MFRARGAPEASLAQKLRAPRADGCTASCGGVKERREWGGLKAGGGGGEGRAEASTVCDISCRGGGVNGARFGGWMCGAGNEAEYGPHCRTCFDDVAEALAAEEAEEERLAGEGGG